ncbi:MAG: M4 family metallopeptidase [Limisphaerales bacterium]
MSDPHNPQLKETGPKTMAEYQNLPNTPEGDLGGVHVNSTIPSYATYLFAGGPNGLGREKAERIVYRALTKYMTQYAGFIDYRRALLSAAKDLHPGGDEANVIAQAFDAVQILEGEATPAPTPVPATTGEERVVFLRAEYDEWLGEFLGYGLYVMDAQQYELVSMNLLSPVRPAVSGDGTWALYVGQDHDLYWTDGEEEEALTDTGEVRTIAMSKDQRYVAFTTTDFDNLIHVLDTQDDSVRSATIEVPTRSGDEVAASFADVLSFNCLGDVLYFDAWTEGSLAQAEYGCWGLFYLRVKDLQCHSVLPLSPGLQVGNPSLANTLAQYLVADYVYTTNGQATIGVVSLDLGRNELGVLLSGLDRLAAPTLRGDDRKLVFETFKDGLFYLNEASLAADGGSIVSGSLNPLLWSATELAYPVGFRSGAYTPPAGRLEVAPATLAFGTVQIGGVTNRTIEMHNAGNADLELIEIAVEGTGADSIRLASAVEKRLAAGQRQQVALAFSPRKAGALAATLRFKSTAPQQADVTLELSGTGEAGPARDYWHDVWKDFEDRYSYFDHKQVNWSAAYETHRAVFQGLTPTQFGQKLNDVLQVLHDWHVYVRLPDGTYVGYQGEYPRNFPQKFFTGYTGGADYANVRNANALYHARLTGNLAHVVVDTLDTGAFSEITDADIAQVFALYSDADGMVLDIRNNSGGNEANATRFASRFTTGARPFGFVRYRQPGSKPYAFDPFLEKILQPAASGQYLKPVATLIGQRCMSSAEWFSLMMKACPNAILIGDRTRGASGNPETRSLPELGLEYSICRWIAYDEQQQPFEDRGIAPAIRLDPQQSIDDNAQRDQVLEKAIEYLQWRRDLGDRLPQVSARSDQDQDGQSDVDEFLAGTDPTQATEPFGFDREGIRIRPQGGVELRWKSVAGRKYHLLRASTVTGPFTRLAADIAATPPANTYPDTTATGPGPHFYQLERVP